MKTTLKNRIEKQRFKNHNDLQKAIDLALWLNFIGQKENKAFRVVQLPNNQYSVEQTLESTKVNKPPLIPLIDSYKSITYSQILDLKKQEDPLAHWEEIIGLFSTANGSLLRFILHYQIPLERLIRVELACRGYDANYNWLGFEKAKQYWFEQ